ncbi:MAG: hypothetical protein ACYC7A_05080 [Thermoanaerobaculia bacterium]
MKRAVAVAFILVLAVTGAARADKTVRHAFSDSMPADGIRRMVIELPVAEIKVRNSRTNDIVIEGVAQRGYRNEKGIASAQKVVDDSTVTIRVRGNRATLLRKFGPAAKGLAQRHVSYDITVSVPAGMELEVRQDVGELDVSGSFGDMDLEVDVGEVKIRTPKSNIRELNAKSSIGEVRTNLGDRIVEKEGLFAGSTHYLNEGGRSVLLVDVNVGEVAIDLTK